MQSSTSLGMTSRAKVSVATAATSRCGQVDVTTLGDREAAVPSLVHFGTDGVVTTGEAAEIC